MFPKNKVMNQSKWPPLKFVEYTRYSNAWDDDKKAADKQSCSLLGVGKFQLISVCLQLNLIGFEIGFRV